MKKGLFFLILVAAPLRASELTLLGSGPTNGAAASASVNPNTLSGLLGLYDVDTATGGAGAGGAGACNSWPDLTSNARDMTGNAAHPDFQPTIYSNGPNGHPRVYFDYGDSLSWVGNPAGDGFRDSMVFTSTDQVQSAWFVGRHANGYLQGSGYGSWTGNNSRFDACGMPGDRMVYLNGDKSLQIWHGTVYENNKVVPSTYSYVPSDYAWIYYEFIGTTTLQNFGWGVNGFDTEWKGDMVAFGMLNRTMTSTERNGVYQYYKSRFALTSSTRPLYVCWGDSITEGPWNFGQLDYASSLITQSTRTVDFINAGKFGELADGGGTRLSLYGSTLYDSNRSRNGLIVMYGINDFIAGHSSATALSDLSNIATTAHAAGFNRLILCTMTKDGQGGRPADFDAKRADYNAEIVAHYATYGYDAAADAGGRTNLSDPTNTTYYQSDTIHLTTAGEQEIANAVFPYITP